MVRSEETQEKIRPLMLEFSTTMQEVEISSSKCYTHSEKGKVTQPVTAEITGNKSYKENLRNVGKLQRNNGLKQLTLTCTEITRP